MLIPQFSLRWLLGVTAVCAAIFSFVGLAVQGSLWAAGISVAIGAGVLLMFVYAGLFAAVWLFSLIAAALRGRRRAAGNSPFQPQSAGRSPFRPQAPAASPFRQDV